MGLRDAFRSKPKTETDDSATAPERSHEHDPLPYDDLRDLGVKTSSDIVVAETVESETVVVKASRRSRIKSFPRHFTRHETIQEESFETAIPQNLSRASTFSTQDTVFSAPPSRSSTFDSACSASRTDNAINIKDDSIFIPRSESPKPPGLADEEEPDLLTRTRTSSSSSIYSAAKSSGNHGIEQEALSVPKDIQDIAKSEYKDELTRKVSKPQRPKLSLAIPTSLKPANYSDDKEVDPAEIEKIRGRKRALGLSMAQGFQTVTTDTTTFLETNTAAKFVLGAAKRTPIGGVVVAGLAGLEAASAAADVSVKTMQKLQVSETATSGSTEGTLLEGEELAEAITKAPKPAGHNAAKFGRAATWTKDMTGKCSDAITVERMATAATFAGPAAPHLVGGMVTAKAGLKGASALAGGAATMAGKVEKRQVQRAEETNTRNDEVYGVISSTTTTTVSSVELSVSNGEAHTRLDAAHVVKESIVSETPSPSLNAVENDSVRLHSSALTRHDSGFSDGSENQSSQQRPTAKLSTTREYLHTGKEWGKNVKNAVESEQALKLVQQGKRGLEWSVEFAENNNSAEAKAFMEIALKAGEQIDKLETYIGEKVEKRENVSDGVVLDRATVKQTKSWKL